MTGNPRNAIVYDAPYLQNEFGDPQFFYVFNLILSFSICRENFEKICVWELLGANVLKQTTTAVATGTSPNKRFNEQKIAVHVRYKSLYILLPSSAKQQREMTRFCVY